MSGTYSLELVALSVVVAVIASFTALDLATRVNERSSSAWLWLAGGAVALGAGIWSMHFIGMLAFRLPIPVAFDPAITAISMVLAILASALALYTLRWQELRAPTVVLSATLIGIGICAMHYTGMLAMRMSPPIHYQPA